MVLDEELYLFYKNYVELMPYSRTLSLSLLEKKKPPPRQSMNPVSLNRPLRCSHYDKVLICVPHKHSVLLPTSPFRARWGAVTVGLGGACFVRCSKKKEKLARLKQNNEKSQSFTTPLPSCST